MEIPRDARSFHLEQFLGLGLNRQPVQQMQRNQNGNHTHREQRNLKPAPLPEFQYDRLYRGKFENSSDTLPRWRTKRTKDFGMDPTRLRLGFSSPVGIVQ